ncbi:helix-turn-helix domain-containing protein [Flavobacterium xueshanense]|uniref:DNA binding domain-containing protein, excisionase family n=1 Tax=Flavobacterium xueshanense TaxID=935223 RepID=A0A1I2AGV6_9FLAO|nr:helix-turn-helix domain-containing protein [Flavobacterium xueshanense]SFE43019.1 DNA binding domain-containing protein, excisionase family [Flavobacterium xueshanense]
MVKNKENLSVQLSVGDLQQLISEAVKEEITKITKVIQLQPQKEIPELLTREEVAKILKVSYTTLFHWNNSGELSAQKIGKRVYYQRTIIMNKLNNVA